ncbi:hypothetical protein D0839_16290 [Bordetella avium]|uniref:hypothetical protein n=1 Tax=Bordetella avium TaxID=521 RepID=UPI000E699A4D|nr:hypothetical protein [Bordetella avium]RIQ65851.1 hypothetical protein D0839_16290 [Bordetella avium]
MRNLFLIAFFLADAATFIFLTFFDGVIYNWWNWLIILPLNGFLATIWPIYWAILRPLLG